ncbi:helix-turn-helix domain-containing protein [Psychroserpens sp. S379A]|uniref:helix-turn-helix domain-containing protein n=1 Tax=Psychroserpens sp. S379A TaxID=3415137 RepID=UPI003C7BA5E7
MQLLKTYPTITSFYKDTGYYLSSEAISFDIIDFASINNDVKRIIAPHRRNFYTIIFFKNQNQGRIQLNTEYHKGMENALLFHGPEHVFSFVRDPNVEGFVVLFSKDFLKSYNTDLQKSFPFFSVYNQNIFHLSDDELAQFSTIIDALFAEKKAIEVIQPLLMAFLQKSLILFSQYQAQTKYISAKNVLVRRFKQLISNHYTESKQVDYYANLLAISPTYLNEVSKALTGKTSKQLIMERILLEAKNLLLHTSYSVAEVAHFLNFSEPTHFVKFFKKETQETPNTYRHRKH